MKNIIAAICLSILLTSCNRNPENVTVVYDTIPLNDTTNFEIVKNINETYTGILPCETCKGILTELILNTDSSTYKITETYQGKSSGDTVMTSAGSYSRNLSQSDAAIVYQLNGSRPDDVRYFKAKGDSAVVMLDKKQTELSSPGLNFLLMKK